MGLNKFAQVNGYGPIALAKAWCLPAIVIGLAFVIGLLGDDGREWFRYERSAIGGGELWRLLTGHLAHLGMAHLLMNAAGLVLVWVLVGRAVSQIHYLLVALLLIAIIDGGFWLFDPDLRWYVGLSGLLHGLLVYGLVVDWRAARLEHGLLLAAILVKLIYEQVAGPLPGSAETASGPVIVNAHLYGAVGGAALALLTLIRVRDRAAI